MQHVPAYKRQLLKAPCLKTLFLPGLKCYLRLPLLITVSMDKYATFNYSAALLFFKSNTHETELERVFIQ